MALDELLQRIKEDPTILKKALQGLSGGMGLKALVMVLAFGAFAAPLRAQEF